MTKALAEMSVTRVKPSWPGNLLVHKATGSNPTSQRWSPTFGERLESSSYPADDAHQAWMTRHSGKLHSDKFERVLISSDKCYGYK